MGNLDLNGDKKWLEEKFDSIEKKIDYQYSNLNQEKRYKSYGMHIVMNTKPI